jgi:hypothetical protein
MKDIKIPASGIYRSSQYRVDSGIATFYGIAADFVNRNGRHLRLITKKDCIGYAIQHGFEKTCFEFLKLSVEEYDELFEQTVCYGK